MKIGLRAKFGFFFVLFSATLLAVIWWMCLRFISEVFLDSYADSIGKMIEVTAFSLELTPEEMHRYGTGGIEDEHYQEILAKMNEIRIMTELEYLYIVYPTGTETAIWLFDASVEDREVLGSPVKDYNSESFKRLREVAETGVKSDYLNPTETDLGSLVSVYYPMKDENGITFAVLGGDKSLNDITDVIMKKVSQVSGQLIGLVVISTLVLLLFVQFCVIYPVRRLKQGVQKMADGELGIQITCRRRDEIGDITRIFNRMSANIRGHIREVEELNSAYQKFVPPETFQILDKSSIVDVRLGDQARTGLSILSMEPVGFQEVTRDMTSERMFRYINGILEETVPAVLGEGGTIERFEKAGLCSFYRNSSEHALKSALSASESLRKSGKKLSAGIAQGPVMIGIAGHQDRMDMISISEQTRISEFLMETAEKYHASVLISGNAAAQIPNLEHAYHCRFLGYLKLTVSGRLEGIIDVYDSDEPEERKFKQMTKDMFEQGVKQFSGKNYEDARQSFIEVLKQYRKDGAAREYLYRCNRYIQQPEDEPEAYLEVL